MLHSPLDCMHVINKVNIQSPLNVFSNEEAIFTVCSLYYIIRGASLYLIKHKCIYLSRIVLLKWFDFFHNYRIFNRAIACGRIGQHLPCKGIQSAYSDSEQSLTRAQMQMKASVKSSLTQGSVKQCLPVPR